MSRIIFRKGKQKEFLKAILLNVNSPSLREFSMRMSVNYQSMKNYFSERRNFPEELFENLLEISKIKKSELDFEILDENYGQVKGGKKSRGGNEWSHAESNCGLIHVKDVS